MTELLGRKKRWANLASPNRVAFGNSTCSSIGISWRIWGKKYHLYRMLHVVAPGAQAKNQQLLNDSTPNSTRLVPVSLKLYRLLYKADFALVPMVPLHDVPLVQTSPTLCSVSISKFSGNLCETYN
ncbi:hypothetical protein HUJ04_011758 [Dendroctonus ponderosae]|nr:hypothetical protein HUJ04_011758 [Dendroctonus ponderosae]